MPQPRSRKDAESDEAQAEAEAAPEQQQAEQQQAEEQRGGTYTVERLISESADFFGVESYITAGALEGHDPTEEMTLDQAKGYIEEFKERVVTTGDDEA